MNPYIARSALRHSIAEEDIWHAYRNRTRQRYEDDGIFMVVGADHSGRLLELAIRTRPGRARIIHAMPARAKHSR